MCGDGNDIQIDKRIYYAVANVEPNNPKAYRTYTPREARKRFFSEGNWGHWDLDDSLYVAEEEEQKNKSSITKALEDKLPKSHRNYKKQMAAIAISKSNSA